MIDDVCLLSKGKKSVVVRGDWAQVETKTRGVKFSCKKEKRRQNQFYFFDFEMPVEIDR